MAPSPHRSMSSQPCHHFHHHLDHGLTGAAEEELKATSSAKCLHSHQGDFDHPLVVKEKMAQVVRSLSLIFLAGRSAASVVEGAAFKTTDPHIIRFEEVLKALARSRCMTARFILDVLILIFGSFHLPADSFSLLRSMVRGKLLSGSHDGAKICVQVEDQQLYRYAQS